MLGTATHIRLPKAPEETVHYFYEICVPPEALFRVGWALSPYYNAASSKPGDDEFTLVTDGYCALYNGDFSAQLNAFDGSSTVEASATASDPTDDEEAQRLRRRGRRNATRSVVDGGGSVDLATPGVAQRDDPEHNAHARHVIGLMVSLAAVRGASNITFFVNGIAFPPMTLPSSWEDALRAQTRPCQLQPVVHVSAVAATSSAASSGIEFRDRRTDFIHRPRDDVREVTVSDTFDDPVNAMAPNTDGTMVRAEPSAAFPVRDVQTYSVVAKLLDGDASLTDEGVMEAVLADATTRQSLTDAEKATRLRASVEHYGGHVLAIERVLERYWAFLDLSQAERHLVIDAISTVKHAIRPSFRRTSILRLRPVNTIEFMDERLTIVAVRWFALFSITSRTPEEALHHSILGQLMRQLGANTPLLDQSPIFRTSLMMSDNGHYPGDMGGPYRQVWSLLSEEMMCEEAPPQPPQAAVAAPSPAVATTADTKDVPATTSSEASFSPRSTAAGRFYRNPLFRFVNSAKNRWLVPDAGRSTAADVAAYRFLGRLLGHAARARSPFALELSPFVWKFLVDDALCVDDFYSYVDRFWKDYVDDDDLLSDDHAAEERFGVAFAMHLRRLRESATNQHRLGDIILRRKAAELAVTHSLDRPLLALRQGLWLELGMQAVRCLTWRDLEVTVCGEATPTFEQVERSTTCALPAPYDAMFWAAMKQLKPTDWADFFYFCTAQKRYPLSKKITISPNKGSSLAHLPSAQTCFSSVQMPLYTSVDMFKERLIKVIACRDMEAM